MFGTYYSIIVNNIYFVDEKYFKDIKLHELLTALMKNKKEIKKDDFPNTGAKVYALNLDLLSQVFN
jgi:hypothetical protein